MSTDFFEKNKESAAKEKLEFVRLGKINSLAPLMARLLLFSIRRTHLKIRFQSRDTRFLKRGDAPDAETYLEIR